MFAQFRPGLREWCEAAGQQTVLHFEHPCGKGVQAPGGFVCCLTLTSDIKRQFTAPAGVRKAVAAQKHNSMVGIYEAPAKQRPDLADLRGGLFPSLATMSNEGT